MIKILFIDSDQDRLEKMIEAFKDFQDIEILKISKKNLFKKDFGFNDWEKLKRPYKIEADIIFRHGRDFYPNKQIKSNAKLKICYGGYEGMDPDAADEEENIYRSIMSSNYLKTHEAKEIINYLYNQTKKRPGVFLPSTYDSSVEKKLSDFHKDFLNKLKR